MRIFQEASALSEPHGDEPIDRFTLSYMAGLARDRIHQLVLQAFLESGLTKAELARRLGMDKSRLSRILNTSSNITAETLGEVMFAIDGSCPSVDRTWPLRQQAQNMQEPVWLAGCLDDLPISGAADNVVFLGGPNMRATSTDQGIHMSVSKPIEAREYA